MKKARLLAALNLALGVSSCQHEIDTSNDSSISKQTQRVSPSVRSNTVYIESGDISTIGVIFPGKLILTTQDFGKSGELLTVKLSNGDIHKAVTLPFINGMSLVKFVSNYNYTHLLNIESEHIEDNKVLIFVSMESDLKQAVHHFKNSEQVFNYQSDKSAIVYDIKGHFHGIYSSTENKLYTTMDFRLSWQDLMGQSR